MVWGNEMLENVSAKFKGMVTSFETNASEEMRKLKVEIDEAKKNWVYAQNYFQNVTDPDLIDHAVYMLEAAEAKYTYLIKQARNPLKVD